MGVARKRISHGCQIIYLVWLWQNGFRDRFRFFESNFDIARVVILIRDEMPAVKRSRRCPGHFRKGLHARDPDGHVVVNDGHGTRL